MPLSQLPSGWPTLPLVVEWLSVSQTQCTVSPTLMVSVAGAKAMKLPAGPTWTVTVASKARCSRHSSSGRYPRRGALDLDAAESQRRHADNHMRQTPEGQH